MATNGYNTRRYPRTLNEAFGPYARWDTTPRQSFISRYLTAIALALFAFTVAASVAVSLLTGRA